MAKTKRVPFSTSELLKNAQTEIICALLRLIPWEKRTVSINKMLYFLNPDSDLTDGYLIKSVGVADDGHHVEVTIRRVNYDYLDQTIHDVTEIDENTNTHFLSDATETSVVDVLDGNWGFVNLTMLKLVYDKAEEVIDNEE